jgi:hypothetical protein
MTSSYRFRRASAIDQDLAREWPESRRQLYRRALISAGLLEGVRSARMQILGAFQYRNRDEIRNHLERRVPLSQSAGRAPSIDEDSLVVVRIETDVKNAIVGFHSPSEPLLGLEVDFQLELTDPHEVEGGFRGRDEAWVQLVPRASLWRRFIDCFRCG